jgi:DNA (cytosine-5)-methyltransferase 1
LRAGNVGKVVDGVRHSGHTAPRPIHHLYARVVTVREGMRLHSYPDWVRMHASKFQGFRQLGNSVPPLLARAIAHEIRKAAGLAPDQPTEAIHPGPVDLLTATGRSAADLLDAA